jgi:hypothetical protein
MIAAVLLAAFAIGQTAQAGENDRHEKLLGSWAVDVSTATQGTFPALLTFTAGGGVIADEPPFPFETSAHGNWISVGRREVAYTFVALIGSAEGPLSGVGTLRLNAGEGTWSGPFKVEVTDASGNVTFSDRGTFSLTRIAVERLD